MLKPAFIDLSHHNTIPQSLLPAKQAGIVGVIHKASEHTSYVDEKVDSRFFLAQDAGLKWGLYHFVRGPSSSIAAQVDHFLEVAAGVSDDDTLYCLDWEDAGVSLDDAVQFMRAVEQATGHSPVLYSGHVLKEALGGHADPRLTGYRLWLAQYASAPTLPPGWTKFWGWQYTDQGKCPGINPPVDLNAYDGSAAQLEADWSGAAVKPPAPSPDQVVDINLNIQLPPGVVARVTVNGGEITEVTS